MGCEFSIRYVTLKSNVVSFMMEGKKARTSYLVNDGTSYIF